MPTADLKYCWLFDPASAARSCIQDAIRCDNEQYAVVPCHPGQMTAVIQPVSGARDQYLYELRCACEALIRTDGGMLPAGIE